MSSFGVFVCPKCREHAQIIEMKGSKMTKCQNCTASLHVRKLRMLYVSDGLEEAVSARTLLQSRVHRLENEMKEQLAVHCVDSASCVPTDVDRTELSGKKTSSKRGPRQLILCFLQSAGGKVDRVQLSLFAEEHGIGTEQLELLLDQMRMSGEIYEPSAGFLRIAE